MKSTIIAKDKEHLKGLIKEDIKTNGNVCDLNYIDVSHITDMSWLFFNSQFNGNISKWNVENVEHMGYMFYLSKFNGDISNWKPFRLDNATDMFDDCQATPPYWLKIENKDERKKSIDSYILAQEMQENLSTRPLFIRKVKI